MKLGNNRVVAIVGGVIVGLIAVLAVTLASKADGATQLPPRGDSGAPAARAVTNNLIHYSPDNGLDSDFLVTCAGGASVWVGEGQSSAGRCGTNYAYVYVYPGQQIVCYRQYVGWVVTWDATGSHPAIAGASTCVMQAD